MLTQLSYDGVVVPTLVAPGVHTADVGLTKGFASALLVVTAGLVEGYDATGTLFSKAMPAGAVIPVKFVNLDTSTTADVLFLLSVQ